MGVRINAMSKTLHIEIPDEVLLGLQKNEEDFSREMRLAAAAKWYEMGVISQDKAAQVAGMSRSELVQALSRMKVSPFQETASEILDAVHKFA